jgi:RNA polymerase sigma-70 factor (ECF subfamily)
VAFPATRWTVVGAARDGDEEAVREFLERYRRPVVRFLAQRGAGDEADDLAQEVFLRLFADGVLAKADPDRGRFRSLVLAVARNVLGHHLRRRQALKRGEGKVVSLGEHDPAQAQEEDPAFDREWLLRLLQLALARLEQAHPNYHEAIRRFLLEGQDQPSVAQAMGCATRDVKNYVYRGRRKLAAFVRDEVRNYTTSAREFEEELEALARLFPGLAA